jgi:uncharacterized protein DUF2341/concanavalin A-like lectin/glucanase superfamily protein
VRSLALVLATGCGFGPTVGSGVDDGRMHDAGGGEPITSAWAHRRALTIDNTGLAALSSFALEIDLDSSHIDYGATAPGGADVRFTDAAGNQLAYEIEEWNPVGSSTIWVGVPTIAANAKTLLWMYYGNPSAADGQDPTHVWDADYVGVWHLVDAKDATGHLASTNHGATSVTGACGPGMHFAGGGQYVDTTSTAYLASWTIEAWMNPATAALATGAASVVSRYPDYMILWSCNGSTFCHKVMFNGSDPSTHIADFDVGVGTWSYVVGRYDGAILEAYVGGARTGYEVTNDPAMDTTYTAKIGTRMDLLGDFVGGLDEVRISRIARTPDYIAAQAKSMTGAYVAFGPDEQN